MNFNLFYKLQSSSPSLLWKFHREWHKIFSMESRYNHIIIGASRAGLSAALTIRQHKPSDTILIVNREDRLPYKRTNLTKKLVSGFRKEDFALYPLEWYEENGITLLNQVSAEKINVSSHTVLLSRGDSIGWEHLLISTGASPSEISIPGSEYLRHLREAYEAEQIRQSILDSRKILILGQGVEGIELAEQCRRMNRDVVVTGLDDRLMKKWLDPALSQRLLDLLKKNGVACIFNAPVISAEHHDLADYPYTLISKESVQNGDLILASAGVKPNITIAESLGICGPLGIAVNFRMETIIPGIYAAGDVLEPAGLGSYGLWHAAEYQGMVAGLNMAGIPTERDNRAARMKCEVFGDFFFSMCLERVRPEDQEKGWQDDQFSDSEGRYLKLFVRDGKTIAALMAGMQKAGAKILEKGVQENLPPAEILESLSPAL